MARDLRSFLELLDARGLLARIDREVDPATEASRLMRELELRGLAGLFTRVRGAHASLAYNLIGSRETLALALDVDEAQIRNRFRAALEHRLEPIVVDDAPVQEVVEQGEQADLRRLPLVTHSEKDAGAYVTAGAVVTSDPVTGRRNVSINRMMLVRCARNRCSNDAAAATRRDPGQRRGNGPRSRGCRRSGAASARHARRRDVAACRRGRVRACGWARGEPMRLVRGVTVALDVPADAEIVIEGVIPAGVREPEGPFGDFLQFYVPEMANHRLRVTAITHRRDPIYQTMVAGSREDAQLLGLSREADVVAAIERNWADLVDARLGPTILGCAVSIRQRYPR